MSAHTPAPKAAPSLGRAIERLRCARSEMRRLRESLEAKSQVAEEEMFEAKAHRTDERLALVSAIAQGARVQSVEQRMDLQWAALERAGWHVRVLPGSGLLALRLVTDCPPGRRPPGCEEVGFTVEGWP